MSKVDVLKTAAPTEAQAKGCGCGGHGKKGAARPTAAGTGERPEPCADEDQYARQPAQSSGCCSGHKAHE